MSIDQLKSLLDRVLSWPPERQADVAAVIDAMEEQDINALCLTDEQVAEVRSRMEDKHPKVLTFVEFRRRLRRYYGV